MSRNSLFRACLFTCLVFGGFFYPFVKHLCCQERVGFYSEETGTLTILTWAQRGTKSFIKAPLRYCLLDNEIAKLVMRPNAVEEIKYFLEFKIRHEFAQNGEFYLFVYFLLLLC